jgi:hypothetical protein
MENVDIPNRFGQTPLIESVFEGNLSRVRLLLEKGAEPNLQDPQGTSALYVVSIIDMNDLIPVETALSIVRALLDAGAEIDMETTSGSTILTTIRNPRITRLLLERGADINHIDGQGNTPLMFSSSFDFERNGERKSLEKVRVLLDALRTLGADSLRHNLEIRNKNGDTALLLAAKANKPNVVKLLLNFGANPLVSDNRGTDLQDLIRRGNLRTIQRDVQQAIDSFVKRTAEEEKASFPPGVDDVFLSYVRGPPLRLRHKRKVSRKVSRKVRKSRKTSRKVRKSRKTSRKVRKSRKTSRKARKSRKTSRKARKSRKTSRKTSRKVRKSRKVSRRKVRKSRKTSRKV